MSPEIAYRSGNHMATNVRSERLCVACNSMLSAAIIHALDTRARAFLIAVYIVEASEVAPIIDAGTPQSRDGQVGNASQVQR
jgi:hypothetical protein